MCTVHAVKSNFQMCEATLMGLYVFYQHIKNLSVELVSPKKKKLPNKEVLSRSYC